MRMVVKRKGLREKQFVSLWKQRVSNSDCHRGTEGTEDWLSKRHDGKNPKRYTPLPGPMPTKGIQLWSPLIDPGARSAVKVGFLRPQLVLSHEPSGPGTLLR
jgi:hypothetical protein